MLKLAETGAQLGAQQPGRTGSGGCFKFQWALWSEPEQATCSRQFAKLECSRVTSNYSAWIQKVRVRRHAGAPTLHESEVRARQFLRELNISVAMALLVSNRGHISDPKWFE